MVIMNHVNPLPRRHCSRQTHEIGGCVIVTVHDIDLHVVEDPRQTPDRVKIQPTPPIEAMANNMRSQIFGQRTRRSRLNHVYVDL